MRKTAVIVALVFAIGAGGAVLSKRAAWKTSAARPPSLLALDRTAPDFQTDIKPIFQARCQPCHFQGGQVYSKLPFDKPETITRLGAKLFTRIRDEKERRLIQEFLDEAKSKNP